MPWKVVVLHYEGQDVLASQPTSQKNFSYDTEAECIAAQDMLKYITRWNGGEPIVSSTYTEYDNIHLRRDAVAE